MRARRLTILGLSLALVPAVAGTAAAQAPPDLLTGFEERAAAGGGPGSTAVPWTTLEEEAAFLAEIDAASERVSVNVIGQSVRGRPLRLVSIGAPAPRDLAQAAEGRVVLFTCSQHGDEPAGREGCLQRIRALAFTEDPRALEHLRTTTVLFMPSANPDASLADTRANAQGIDINRDHLDAVSPEGQTIDALIRDVRPDVVADMHEFGSRALYDTELLYLWPRNRNVDPAVQRLSRRLSQRYVGAGAEAAGFSAGVYGITVLNGQQVAQDAGDEDERILRNAVGLRHSVGLLVETDDSANRRNPEEADDPVAVQSRRVATQVQAGIDVLRFQRDRATEVEAATEEAGPRAAAEGAARDEPFYLAGADNRLPLSSQVLYPPPCAYDLTVEQADRLSGVFALHGITTTARGADVRVSMAQEAQPRIPLLLDATARFSPVDGRRVTACGGSALE